MASGGTSASEGWSAADSWMQSTPSSRAKPSHSSIARSGSLSRISRGVSSCSAAVSTPIFMNFGSKLRVTNGPPSVRKLPLLANETYLLRDENDVDRFDRRAHVAGGCAYPRHDSRWRERRALPSMASHNADSQEGARRDRPVSSGRCHGPAGGRRLQQLHAGLREVSGRCVQL